MVDKPRQDRALRTRDKILSAAVTSLVDWGYRATTMQRVQEIAGVSRGTLTHHFATLHALLAAAIAHIAKAQVAQIQQVDRRPQSASQAVAMMYPAQSGTLFTAGLELWSAARTNAALREELLPAERHLGAQLRDILADALTPVEMETLFALFRGLAVTRILRSNPEPERQALQRWAEMVDASR